MRNRLLFRRTKSRRTWHITVPVRGVEVSLPAMACHDYFRAVGGKYQKVWIDASFSRYNCGAIHTTLVTLRQPLSRSSVDLDVQGSVSWDALLIAFWSNDLGGDNLRSRRAVCRPATSDHGHGSAFFLRASYKENCGLAQSQPLRWGPRGTTLERGAYTHRSASRKLA